MKTQLLNLIAPDRPLDFQEAYLRARSDPKLNPLTKKILAAEGELHDLIGRNDALLDAVERSISGGGTVAESLQARINFLAAQLKKARDEQSALAALIKSRRDDVAPLLAECIKAELSLPREIAFLESCIQGYEKTRAEHHDTLVSAGLDDAAIARAGLRPNQYDLSEWQSTVVDKKKQLDRVKAFGNSGPEFDECLLASPD